MKLARRNARRLGLKARFAAGDLFDALPATLRGTVDVITLHPAVRARRTRSRTCPTRSRSGSRCTRSPIAASDGLGLVRRTVEEAPDGSGRNGWLLMETDPDRARDVKRVMRGRRVPRRREHEGRRAEGDARDRRAASGVTTPACPVRQLVLARSRRRCSRARGRARGAVARGRLVYWLETRPTEEARRARARGRVLLARGRPSRPGSNVRTVVHEYGGGAFAVHRGHGLLLELRRPTALPARAGKRRAGRDHAGDGRRDTASPTAASPPTARRGSACASATTGERVPQDVTNELVAIPTDGSAEPRVIASAARLLSRIRGSPRTARALRGSSWDLPWMPWDGTRVARSRRSRPTARSASPRPWPARAGEESIWQPSWSPAGELYWASDRTRLVEPGAGARRADGRPCARARPSSAGRIGSSAASSYAFLGDGRIACHYGSGGVQHTAVLDPVDRRAVDLDIPHTAVSYPSLVAEGSQIAFIAGGPALPEQVVSLDFTSRAVDVLRESASTSRWTRRTVDPATARVPDGRRPHRASPTSTRPRIPGSGRPRRAAAADRDQPRRSDVGVDAARSRPRDAVLDQPRVRGGRRELRGQHGVRPRVPAAAERHVGRAWTPQDCINAARHLAEQGAADGERLLIRGGSAPAGTRRSARWCSTTTSPPARATSGSPTSCRSRTAARTSSSREYSTRWSAPSPRRGRALPGERARSTSSTSSATPMLVLQGAEDEVVPPAQAELIVEALERKGLPTRTCCSRESSTGSARPRLDQPRARGASCRSTRRSLASSPGDPVPRLAIENLPA